ncbi:MAG TPA: hypothetical protein VN495_02745, partial [Candidatus Paceibacterota bacterium]|nr:hypothetical protein [Candidatus Paceibacterota bacterium]
PDFVHFREHLYTRMEVLRDPSFKGAFVRESVPYKTFLRTNRSAAVIVRSANFCRNEEGEAHRVFSLFLLYWALREHGTEEEILRLGAKPGIRFYLTRLRFRRAA